MRAGVVLAGVAAAAASATTSPPPTHNIQRVATVPLDFEATWTAVIDVFAAQGWAIEVLNKDSGLITTDWMELGEEQARYADCDTHFSRARPQIRFNVRLKPIGETTELTVNARFREVRFYAGRIHSTDCKSRGTVEALVHEQVRRRTAVPAADTGPGAEPAPAAVYWCSEQGGGCATERSECVGICRRATEVWCTRFTNVKGGHGFACGRTRDDCSRMRDDPEHKRGRVQFRPCTPHKATGTATAPPAPATPPAAPASAPNPRGFFCASSTAAPGTGFCTREKADCQRARDAALAVVADLEECRLVETAFCHVSDGRERCGPTMAACTERARSGPGAAAASPCAEQK